MTVDQFSSSHGGGCDIEGIRRFWDEMLQRLRIHAELAELETVYASGSEQDSKRPIDGNGKQTQQGDDRGPEK